MRWVCSRITRFQCLRLSRSFARRDSVSLPPPSSQRKKPSKARIRPPEAMRKRVAWEMALRPSRVLGPVLIPPWFLHRPLDMALAWQGLPVLLAWAPQVCLRLIRLLLVSGCVVGVRPISVLLKVKRAGRPYQGSEPRPRSTSTTQGLKRLKHSDALPQNSKRGQVTPAPTSTYS
jgi:hypothetical protein